MKKKGLSGIVMTVILIALVLIAAFIVWAIASNFMDEKEGEVVNAPVAQIIKVQKAFIEGGRLNLTVKRLLGPGPLHKIRVVLTNGAQEEEIFIPTTIKESQVRSYLVGFEMVPNPTKVFVYPVTSDDEKDYIGVRTDEKDVYKEPGECEGQEYGMGCVSCTEESCVCDGEGECIEEEGLIVHWPLDVNTGTRVINGVTYKISDSDLAGTADLYYLNHYAGWTAERVIVALPKINTIEGKKEVYFDRGPGGRDSLRTAPEDDFTDVMLEGTGTTVSFWAKTSDSSAIPVEWGSSGGVVGVRGTSFGFWGWTDGKAQMFISYPGNYNPLDSVGSSVSFTMDDDFHHYSYSVYHAETSDTEGYIKFCRDEVCDTVSYNLDLYHGRWQNDVWYRNITTVRVGDYFQGYLRDVKIYNKI